MNRRVPLMVLDAFTTAQLAGDRHAALDVVLAAVEAGASPEDVYAEVIEPAQYTLGRGWATGALRVADEQLATAVTQHVVSALRVRRDHRSPSRGRATVTGVAGESHQIGARIIADALEADGWQVQYVGSDAPVVEVVGAIATFEPQLVCISTTMLDNVTATTSLITGVRAVNPDARILVGGGAFHAWDNLWKRCGAEAVAGDVREAVIAART